MLRVEWSLGVKCRGNGTTLIIIYIALVSISSLAFATVALRGDGSSIFDEVPLLGDAFSRGDVFSRGDASSLGEASVNDANCLSPDSAAASDYTYLEENQQRNAFEGSGKVLLTSFPGSIRRVDKNENTTYRADKQNTVWNPLAKVWLTAEQVALLKMAFNIAYQDGGLQHAKLIQGILLQETLAGLVGRIGHMSAPVGKRSYGVMQVKATAANDVLGRHAFLGRFSSDKELITHLIVDDEFNIRIASKLFLHLRAKTKTDNQALLAYNIGLRASRRYTNYDAFHYVIKVKKYSKQIAVPFNEKFNGKVV